MGNDQMIIISDSSPLISLAIIGKLGTLTHLYEEIYVPTAVYKEVTKANKPFAKELKLFLTGKTKNVQNKMAVDILLSDIGAGEAEAIILALEQHPDVILIDDLKARRFAKIKGVNVMGTMGLLLMAKKEGLIEEIKPLLSDLLSNNIRISTKIMSMTLHAAGEMKSVQS